MYRISIQTKGPKIGNVIKSLERKVKWSQEGLNRIHKNLLDELRIYIDEHRKRDKVQHGTDTGIKKGRYFTRTNNLFNVIKATSTIFKYQGNYVFSIGNKDFLNQYAPYWYLINYGGKVPNAGEFVPGYFGRGAKPGLYRPPLGALGRMESFHYTGGLKGAHPGMKPMKPIAPMYYLNFLARRFEESISLLEKDSLDFTHWKGT